MPASCLRQGRGVAPQASRLLAFRKAGKVPAKLTARTRVIVLHKRERQLAGAWPHGPCRPLAFGKGGGLHPRQAGFLRSARPGRSQRNHRRARASSSCTSASVRSPLRGANWPVRPRTANWPVRPRTPLFLKRGSPFPRVRRLMIVLNKLREFPEEEGGCCGATGTQGPAGRQKRLYGLD